MTSIRKIGSLAQKKAQRMQEELRRQELTKDIREEKKLNKLIKKYARKVLKEDSYVSVSQNKTEAGEHSIADQLQEYKAQIDMADSMWAPWSKHFYA